MIAGFTPPFAFWTEGGQQTLALSVLLVFGAAKLLAEIFERFGMPGLVGEIIAGMLIGPAVLDWIQPNELLTALSELGVMFLLFRVGLEVKSSELIKIGGRATLVAMLGVVVPFFAGWGILLMWGYPQIESIFVGAAMVATSVGITAQVLAAKGYLNARASKIILAAAVIDDVLGLLVLAVVSSIAREGRVNILELALTATLAIGFTLVVARWGTRTMDRLVPHIERRFRAGEVQFNLSILMLFCLSLLAIYAGVAAIIGAFLAGMALAETVGHRVHDLVHGVTELLVPFFLVGIGLHLELGAFREMNLVILTIVIVIAAVVSKLIGCGLAALPLGRGDALRIGVGMAPRGEVGMVVAQLGQRLGVIEGPVYGVVVFMAIATTVIAPPLLKIAYRDVPVEAPQPQADEFTIG